MPLLPTTNADGRDVVPMTEAQKYLFDLKGFIALPGLLTQQELQPMGCLEFMLVMTTQH